MVNEQVNLTKLIFDQSVDRVFTKENGFEDEQYLETCLEDAMVDQVCSVCWKPRKLVESPTLTDNHSGKSCDLAGQLTND